MSYNWLRAVTLGAVLVAAIWTTLVPIHTHAIDLNAEVCKSPTSQDQKDQCALIKQNKLNKDGDTSAVKNGINTALGMLGIISVIMIVIGGMRYTLSLGDSAGIQNAKNTILYAVIGLIVAILSFALVQLVSIYFK